jgi:hypothetical protein
MSEQQSTRTSAGASVTERPQVLAPRVAPVSLAAAGSTTQYADVFVRDNFGDTGVIPSTGVPYMSPDIIPYQSNVLTVQQAAATYGGPDIGMPFLQPGTNNIYVRAENLWPTGTETGTVQLYYANASLFMVPSQWTQNVISTSGGISSVPFVNQSGSTELNPNDICLVQEAFYLASLPSGAHYCLVAVVNTPNTTVTVPASFASNAAFVTWVQATPAVAWRNLGIVANGATQILQTLAFGSDDPDSNEFHFSVNGTDMPVGTSVTLQCTAQGATFNQTVTLPAADPLGNQLAGFDQVLPGNFQAGLSVTATPPAGQSFQTGSTLSVTYYEYPPDEMTDEHLQAGRFRTIARTAPGGTRAAVTAFLLQIGQCNFSVEASS